MEEPAPERVPEHFTQNLTLGWDAWCQGEQPRLRFQFNIENLSNNLYKVAQESVFSPGQYSIPRMFSGSIKIHFGSLRITSCERAHPLLPISGGSDPWLGV